MPVSRACSILNCGKIAKARGWCDMHWARWRHHGDPLISGRTARGIPLKFLDEALSYRGEECLRWPFSGSRGYGSLCIGGRTQEAHRVICEEINGPPPTPEHQAAHRCGQGKQGCIAPNHLSWKTPKENEADKLIHGTMARGERQGSSKLNREEVLAIRKLSGSMSHRLIGEKFGVSKGLVSYIIARKRWAWLD